MMALTILFSGMMAGDPYQGGATWAVLQYVLGLRELGHEVWFVEPMQQKAVESDGGVPSKTQSATYFETVVQQFGLSESAALLWSGTRETVGVSYERLEEAAARADLLINVSGMLTDRNLSQR